MKYLTPALIHTRLFAPITTLLLVLGLTLAPISPALADTMPPSGTPATVSADPLPTVQIDGIVWKQAIVGTTVYATGQFTTARPPEGVAGVSATRTNLLAYDITTGKLDTKFIHSLSGGDSPEGRSIAASPDGKRLYVGGKFTTVDGQARSNVAAFDLTTNTLLSGFTGANSTVRAIAATNSQVFIGGIFTSVAGAARSNLAAFKSDGSLNTAWVANVGHEVAGQSVAALTAVESAGNLIVGGSFTKINNQTFYSLGALKLATGVVVSPWASSTTSFPIRMTPQAGVTYDKLGITSLSNDGSQVYFTAFTYTTPTSSTFEGRAAINPVNGNLIWMNDCVGDSYDAFPIGQVLYSVNHSHSCTPIGGFPQQTSWRALAETIYATGKNGTQNITKADANYYPSYAGQPSGSLLNWFPTLNTGTVSGSGQAAWSVVGTASYVALGGEFTLANNAPQQGLVRYAVASAAPNALGPLMAPFSYPAGYAIMPYPASSTGVSKVRIYVTGDPDNAALTYQVYRASGTTLLASQTVDSRYWQGTSWTFNDSGVTPGTVANYRLVVKDPYGNSRSYNDASVIDDSLSLITYSGSGWSGLKNRGDTTPDFARSIHVTSTKGDSASLNFTGTTVTVLAQRSTTSGTFSVSIDGGAAQTVDLTGSVKQYQQKVFTKTGLAAGSHTIRLTNTNGKSTTLDALYVK